MGEAKRKSEAAAEGAPRIELNPLNRWVIMHPHGPLAWSGSRWVLAVNGLPIGGVQICNFETSEEALVYVGAHVEEIKNAALETAPAGISLRRETALPNHWNEEKPDDGAFRCPYCGKWRPGYSFNGQVASMPPTGVIEYMNVSCGECHTLLQIIITGFDPGLGRGRRQ